jgi:putative pyoverdin transport system ATP-binding/permease protein
MSFFQLVRREMQGSLPRLIFMSGLAGISNAAILAAINSAAQASSDSKPSIWAAALFVIGLFIFIKTQHYVLIATTVEIEAIIHSVRVRLMDQVRRSELVPLEAIGRARIVGGITRDTTTLTQAATMLAFAAQGLVLIFFVAIYVAYLSLLAFAISVAVVGLAAALFHMKSRELNQGRQQAGEWENRLFERVTDLLEGFKEVRLNRWRSEHLFDDIVEVSRTAANIKIRTESETLKRLVFSQSAMFVLLGAIVFVVPTFSDAGGDSITKTTTALLFVVGACFGLVQTIPVLTAANAAADNLERLETELRSTVAVADAGDGEPTRNFDSIEMRNIVFRYVDKSSEAAFKIGPIDFTLRRGDLVFITGGNGSGKSTFLRVLAGLYKPETGEITLDGKRVTDATLESYRSLIAAIFTDYHLFQRLYGIPDPDHAEVDRLLTDFRLHDKTGLTDGEFRTLDLSGGQRKRLALIVSLLEKRPILLLDEWTADQDPEFRRKFYDELLPALTRAGATVVVITHDDRYLNELDLPARRLRMDEGRFVEQHSVERA